MASKGLTDYLAEGAKSREWLTIAEAMLLSGKSKSTVWRLVHNGAVESRTNSAGVTEVRWDASAFFGSKTVAPDDSYIAFGDAVTIADAARSTGVPRSTLYRWVQSGKISARDTSAGVKVSLREICALAEARLDNDGENGGTLRAR